MSALNICKDVYGGDPEDPALMLKRVRFIMEKASKKVFNLRSSLVMTRSLGKGLTLKET